MSADFSDVKIVHKFAIQRARAAVPVNEHVYSPKIGRKK